MLRGYYQFCCQARSELGKKKEKERKRKHSDPDCNTCKNCVLLGQKKRDFVARDK